MRTVVLGCLLASALSTIAFTGAEAQNSCSVNVTRVDDCAATYAPAAPGNICRAIHNYMGCVGDIFSCNTTHFSTEWNEAVEPYRSLWDSHCSKEKIPGIDGAAETSLAFGDPHYQLTDGTHQSCNDTGTFYYAVSKYYTVTVYQSTIGTTPVNETEAGTYVSQVTVVFYHAGAPTGAFMWSSGGSTPTATSTTSVTIRDDGIRADALGLNLKITKGADHLLVAGLTKKINGGIVLNGCADENKADLPSTTGITGPCARLPSAYQASCLYDAARISETWAVAAATGAAAEKTILNDWAYNQNGAGSVALLSGAAVAVATLLAMVL